MVWSSSLLSAARGFSDALKLAYVGERLKLVELRDKQIAPGGDWRIWLLLAGRGFGKTQAITQWAIEQARAMPKSRGALVATTTGDARDVLVEGESGILAIAPADFMPRYEPSKRRLTFPNGSIATTFSADEPNRLRGPQFHWAICDEIAAWQYPEAFDMLLLGLRLGRDPRVAVATTPRPTPIIKRMLADPTCVVVRGSTYENEDNLAPAFLSAILNRYQGTILGRQEIDAEILDDLPGALWKRVNIAHVSNLPNCKRIVVAIDPAVTATDRSDETGIVVAGLGIDGEGYVLEDKSLVGSPDQWAREAIACYHKWKADKIVVEVNNGGDLCEHTLRTVDSAVPIKQIRASRGKITRAEPIAALYEQGKVHHVGTFGALEDQMCSTLDGADSPDRVDALVWAISELMLKPERFFVA